MDKISQIQFSKHVVADNTTDQNDSIAPARDLGRDPITNESLSV